MTPLKTTTASLHQSGKASSWLLPTIGFTSSSFYSISLHPIADVPIPVPVYRSDSRIRTHRDSSTHCTRMVCDLVCCSSGDMERRPYFRPKHSHHLPLDRLSRRQRHSWWHHERGPEIHWHVPHAHGRSLSLPDYRRMGR